MTRFRLKADATFQAIDYFEACEKIAKFFAAKSEGRYIREERFYAGSVYLTYAHLAKEDNNEPDQD